MKGKENMKERKSLFSFVRRALRWAVCDSNFRWWTVGPWRRRVATETQPRADQYRDLLEAWVQWWNHLGRYHYHHPGIPPLTVTGDALRCTACADVGPYEAENGPERCQVCHRRVP